MPIRMIVAAAILAVVIVALILWAMPGVAPFHCGFYCA